MMTTDQNQAEPIVNEEIEIEPFQFLSIVDFQIIHQSGDHSFLYFYGMVTEEEAKKYQQASTTKLAVTVNKKDEVGERFPFYKGIVTDLKVIEDNGVFYLQGEAASYTYLMDIKKKRRSYQMTENLYENLLSEVVVDYDKVSFLDMLSKQQPVGQFFTQYDETDWAFICRLASHFHGLPMSTDQYDEIKFYFGVPKGSKVEKLAHTKYKIIRKQSDFHLLHENSKESMLEKDFIEYQVESTKILPLGAKVSFLGQELFIVSLERVMDRQVIVNRYSLRPEKGILIEKQYNEKLKGNSVYGTVTAVQTDKVLLQLEIDPDKNAYYWFTYSTGYTSDDNVGWYMMPEVGEKVRLYYPTLDEKDVLAMSTVRTEVDDHLNPAIKTLSNKHGKTITLEPDRITIVGDGVEIVLKDNESINITSTGSVNITAEGDISMQGNNVLLDAGSSIGLSAQGNSLTVDGQIAVSGSEIKLN